MAHESVCLVLLHPCPDTVHRFPSHETSAYCKVYDTPAKRSRAINIMKDLTEVKNTIEFLRSHGVSVKKRYGQNFLTDRSVLENIIKGAGITADDLVLEIGPGIGTLTRALCESADRVIAVEIDKDLIPLLKENLSGYDNCEIINADILKLPPAQILPDRTPSSGTEDSDKGGKIKKIKVAANLPYYITTPIIMYLLGSGLPMESITIMVQKEVAERMQAMPGGKEYGALSLAVQYYSAVRTIAKVPASSFYPSPKVESAVIRLDLYDEPPVKVCDEQKLFAVIKAAFLKRRKKLSNALSSAPGLGISRETVSDALTALGLGTDIRGERLSLSEYAALTNLLMQ